jgi:circadian clock protein KaiC
MLRNMRAAGVDLASCVDEGRLQFHADRPSRHGLETHLVLMHKAVEQFRPDVVIVDPMTNLLTVGTQIDVRAMLTRMIDFLKTRTITALFTSLTPAGTPLDSTETVISSLMDTWVLMTTEEVDRRRHRWVSVLKSRGMPHSDEVREFRFSSHGIDLLPVRGAGPRG